MVDANAPTAAKRIVGLAELDATFAEIAASPKGPAAHFRKFWFDMPIDPGLNPLSTAYRDAVLAYYRQVSGLSGSPVYETVQLDIGPDDPLVLRPWPYNTGSATQIGHYLQAIGFVIGTCQPRPGHRVLQMGIGDIDYAIPLASLGCAVTAIDPDARRVAVLRRRAEKTAIPLLVKQAAFNETHEVLPARHYDIVIIPSMLHRQLDHLQILRLVREYLLARGGRLILAGEPLLEAFPAPWGLQQDGASLWAMRHGGGLLLVFRPSYLIQAFAVSGFTASLSTCPQTALGNVLIGVRAL